jgi:hypothetical protein
VREGFKVTDGGCGMARVAEQTYLLFREVVLYAFMQKVQLPFSFWFVNEWVMALQGRANHFLDYMAEMGSKRPQPCRDVIESTRGNIIILCDGSSKLFTWGHLDEGQILPRRDCRWVNRS